MSNSDCAEDDRMAHSCLVQSQTKALLSVAIGTRAGSTCPARKVANVDIEQNGIHFSEPHFTGCARMLNIPAFGYISDINESSQELGAFFYPVILLTSVA